MTQEQRRPLTRRELSDAVSSTGWRLVLALFQTDVAVRSFVEAGAFTAAVTAAIDASAAAHLRLDARPDRVIVTIENLQSGSFVSADLRYLDADGACGAVLEGRLEGTWSLEP